MDGANEKAIPARPPLGTGSTGARASCCRLGRSPTGRARRRRPPASTWGAQAKDLGLVFSNAQGAIKGVDLEGRFVGKEAAYNKLYQLPL